jgi:hypothetical protein
MSSYLKDGLNFLFHPFVNFLMELKRMEKKE